MGRPSGPKMTITSLFDLDWMRRCCSSDTSQAKPRRHVPARRQDQEHQDRERVLRHGSGNEQWRGCRRDGHDDGAADLDVAVADIACPAGHSPAPGILLCERISSTGMSAVCTRLDLPGQGDGGSRVTGG